MKFYRFIFMLFLMMMFVSGCIVSNPKAKHIPLKTKSLDAVLVVAVDLSGSFAKDFSDRAYPLLLNVMRKYFVEQMGNDCKVILAQISAQENAVLFEGTPRDLRRRFDSPEALAEFLLDNSKPNSSPVFEAMEETLHYVNQLSDVDADTSILTVIASDLKDSEQDRAIWKQKGDSMLAELKRYQQLGGAIALYHVDVNEVELWKKVLASAKFEPGMSLISNDMAEDPPLPTFH